MSPGHRWTIGRVIFVVSMFLIWFLGLEVRATVAGKVSLQKLPPHPHPPPDRPILEVDMDETHSATKSHLLC
jgi:hypothetical protein